MSRMEFGERERRIEYVAQLTPLERGVYADMVMRSLRGSWSSPQKRTKLLEIIAGTGDVEPYDADRLRESVKGYFERIGRGAPDGRYWRRFYENAEVDHASISESKVRELASRIPDDMTWNDRRITKEFTDD